MNARNDAGLLPELQRRLADFDPRDAAARWMQTLATEGLAALPRPGTGAGCKTNIAFPPQSQLLGHSLLETENEADACRCL